MDAPHYCSVPETVQKARSPSVSEQRLRAIYAFSKLWVNGTGKDQNRRTPSLHRILGNCDFFLRWCVVSRLIFGMDVCFLCAMD